MVTARSNACAIPVDAASPALRSRIPRWRGERPGDEWALVQASTLDAVGLRVGSYLVVGGFLLTVGYWYRAADGVGLFRERGSVKG